MDREPQSALLESRPAASDPDETRHGLLHADNELADLGAKDVTAVPQGPLSAGRWAPAGSINNIYQKANLCLVALWLLSFIVLGAAASVLAPAEHLPEVIPLAAYAVACVSAICIHVPCSLPSLTPPGWHPHPLALLPAEDQAWL